ncbi:methyltransferase [Janthinobacterium sp. RB2R34]|uniref:methyltransferase n=1 Tax=Janthinobacterium sp. RB2R34 TaxID=3424193 RepID=UPI003F210887
MADFQTRDPLSPAFWDERFSRQFTPWDQGGVPRRMAQFVAGSPAPLRCLIPGCGSAYELALMLDHGWNATAIDFSPGAVAAAQAVLGERAGQVELADFFAWQPPAPLDLVYERAFLCAMPRAMWPQVAERWAQLLAPGAMLAGYFFFDDNPKGPPFGIAREQLLSLLTPHFDCLADESVDDSIPVFTGKEHWMVWRRRAS